MSQWMDDMDDEFLRPQPGPEPVDELEDELDEFPAAPSTDDEGPEEDDLNWEPRFGFPDQRGIVRVWANEDGTLDRVRVSLHWRDKLKDTPLDRCFVECFMLMNGFHQPDILVPDPEPLPPETATGLLTWDLIASIQRQQDALDAQIAALEPSQPRWVGKTAQGSDFEDGVIVELDLHGRPVVARFDQEWLDTPATSSEIARGVMGAYRRARKAYVPPTAEYDERTRLVQRKRQLNQLLMDSAANGVQI